jgi:hypothetical protein
MSKVVIYTDRQAFSGKWERQVAGMGWNENCMLTESWFLRNTHLEDQDENMEMV